MKHFELGLTLTVAGLVLAGCDGHQDTRQIASQDTAICVDRQGNRVPDGECNPGVSHGPGISPFLWYYLGRASAVPYYGERAFGGSFTRTAGATYFHAPVSTSMTRSAAVARGGFGSSAHAFGGVHS